MRQIPPVHATSVSYVQPGSADSNSKRSPVRRRAIRQTILMQTTVVCRRVIMSPINSHFTQRISIPGHQFLTRSIPSDPTSSQSPPMAPPIPSTKHAALPSARYLTCDLTILPLFVSCTSSSHVSHSTESSIPPYPLTLENFTTMKFSRIMLSPIQLCLNTLSYS